MTPLLQSSSLFVNQPLADLSLGTSLDVFQQQTDALLTNDGGADQGAYESALRQKAGRFFADAANQEDLKKIGYFRSRFALGVEEARPGLGAIIRGKPRTIREGIFRRAFEASFDADPALEEIMIAGVMAQADKTLGALEEFFILENAGGMESRMRRAVLKRRIRIAFKDAPQKFEFENRANQDAVVEEARRYFDEQTSSIRSRFAFNREFLDRAKSSYGVEEDIQQIEKAPQNRFLRWYHHANLRNPYAVGVVTAGTAYIGGSVIAKMIVGDSSPITWEQVGVLGALSLYYGWEGPLTIDTLHADIPKHRFKHIGKVRAAVYMFGFSPFWTIRHAAFLGMMHGTADNAMGIIKVGLATWGSTLPLTYSIETFIQGIIPLQYRFLTRMSAVTLWHMVASLWTLLG